MKQATNLWAFITTRRKAQWPDIPNIVLPKNVPCNEIEAELGNIRWAFTKSSGWNTSTPHCEATDSVVQWNTCWANLSSISLYRLNNLIAVLGLRECCATAGSKLRSLNRPIKMLSFQECDNDHSECLTSRGDILYLCNTKHVKHVKHHASI